MSFSGEVKKELCELTQEKNNCCKLAECYGCLVMGKSFSAKEFRFSTEYDFVVNYVSNLLSECDEKIVCSPVKNNKKFQLKTTQSSKIKKIFDLFGHEMNQVNLRINRANFADDCCLAAFLRGAFLSCGSISDPTRNYHLEFVVPFYKLSHDLFKLISDAGINAKIVVRKGSYVIYIKDSESIEELLTLMGAQKATLRIMYIKIQKDMRNKINRKVNFECANIERSIKAGLEQKEAIELIKKRQGLDTLPPAYKELAVLRLENPDMSLKQLGESLSTPLSRSGVKHRLDRLIEISDKLKK